MSTFIERFNKNLEQFKEHADLLKATAAEDNNELSVKARQKLVKIIAQVAQRAWRAGTLETDTISGIYTRIPLERGADAHFPFDFYTPADGDAADGPFKAFTVPDEGKIPERVVGGSEIYVKTFTIANAISWPLTYAMDARWDIIARAIEVYVNGFIQKNNDDGWHGLLTCGTENSISVDSGGTDGVLSKRLLTNMQVDAKRLVGGRGNRLTHVYLSPEALGDLRNFDNGGTVGQIVDDATLRALLGHNGEAPLPTIFGLNLVELEELGANQEYEDFIVNDLATAHTGSKEEFVVGLNLRDRDSFVMPVREEMQMFDDPTLHRHGRAGVYGRMRLGFGCLDSRRVLLGEL